MYSETSPKVCADEETELRDLIMQNLENCGFLSKIKAELRAGVFLALEEDGNLKHKIPLVNKKLDDFMSTNEGKLIVSVIREFFEFFNLHFTLSVFDPEVAASVPRISRSELCDQINIKDSLTDSPVISSLLKEIIGIKNTKLPSQSVNADSLFEKSSVNESIVEKSIKDVLNQSNSKNEEKIAHSNSENDSIFKNLKEDIKLDFSSSETAFKSDVNIQEDEFVLDTIINKEKKDEDKKENIGGNKESNDGLTLDHDPFFDVPVPSEKSSFFSFSDVLKDKPESKLTSIKKDTFEPKKNSLSSLRDLPSLTASNEWSFSRDPKNTLPSLDSLKSVSSSEESKEEIINLDYKDDFEKKNSDIVESNEDTSEKQNSDESIEEEMEDDSSVNFDELMNSSLSLGEDQTTDQTVSQVSIVKGADHVEST